MPDERATFFEPLPLEEQRNTKAANPNPDEVTANPASAATAARVHKVATLFPWLKPDVALAIAQSGQNIYGHDVAALARQSADSKVKHGFNWLSPGDWVDKGSALARSEGSRIAATARAEGSEVAGAARVVGAPISAVAQASGSIIPGSVRTGLKAGVRGVGVGLESGGQLLNSMIKTQAKEAATQRAQGINQGVPLGSHAQQTEQATANAQITDPNNPGVRFGDTQNPFTSNALAVTIGDIAHGKPVDLGTGLMPGGAVEEAVKKRAIAQASVPGPSGTRLGYTVGRGLSTGVFEPGTAPATIMSGLVDAAVSWELDPTNIALTKIGDARQVAKTLGAAGIVDGGARQTVVADKVSQWLDGNAGRKVLGNIADEPNARRIWEKLPGLTPSQAVTLAQTKTPEETRAALEPLLGVNVRSTPASGFVGALPDKLRRTADHVRILGQMPGRQLDLNDENAVGRQIIDLMRNAKVDPALIDQRFAQAGAATSNIGRGEAVTGAYSDVNDALLGRGVQESVARRATQLFDESRAGAARYNVDAIGNNVGSLGATINGDGLATAHPQLIGEYLDHVMPQPDARSIRRLASPLRPLLAKIDPLSGVALPRLPTSVLDFSMDKMWRPLTIGRPATALRIIGDTQIRMAATGLDSLVSHPIEAVAWIVGRKGDALGDEFNALEDFSTFKKFMSTKRINMSEGAKARLWDVVRRDQPGYIDGLAGELAQLNADPVARRIAGGLEDVGKVDHVRGGSTGNNVQDVKNWFWSGEPGKTLRLQLAEDSAKTELATSRAAADQYINEVADRVNLKTGGHDDLMSAVATGMHGDEHIVGEGATNAAGFNRRFISRLQELSDQGVTPPVVKTSKYVRNTKNANLLDAMDKATSTIMHATVGAPLSTISASPAFRQLYWRRMAELAQHVTADGRATILENADRYNIPDAIKNAIRDAPVGGAYTAEQAHLLATGYVADRMPTLMHTLVNKSQFADIARNFFPFAEVWKNTLKAVAKIGVEQPQVFRRFQQIVNGARQSGFFAPDPQTGEETFTFPLSSVLTKHILGVPVNLTGDVAGLNMFSRSPLLPGFGPTVQVAVSKILPDKPEFDDLRKMIAPFGTEELGASFVPGWFTKLRTAIRSSDGDRLYANTVADMASSLYSSGKYDTSSDAGVDHLLSDARSAAKRLYLIRAVAQFAGPTPVSPEVLAHDKIGDLQLVSTMATELQRLQDEDRASEAQGKPQAYNADERFLSEFGSNALLFLQSKTTRSGTGPVSTSGLNWVRTNTGVVKQYPDVYGYFAPQGADFNYDAYTRLLKNGELTPLKPKEYVQAANARAARMIYANVRDQMGVHAAGTTQGRVTLANLREKLTQRFPGYEPGIVDTGKRDTQIRELRKAADDPRLANNQVANAVSVYLGVRDAALNHLKAHGLLSLTSKAASAYAAQLRSDAAKLVDQVPGFADVFDYVFSGELGDG